MTNINLKNKKVLYLGLTSVSYDKAIIIKIEEYGAKVTSHDLGNIFSDDLLFRAYIKIVRKKQQLYDEYLKKFCDQIYLQFNFDYIVVRHGYQLDETFYQHLREINPNAKLISFHWDSIKPDYNYLYMMKYFDKVFSFDIDDCKKYPQINYLPLFYLDVYEEFRIKEENIKSQKSIDLLFIGAWRNKERYNLILKTEEICKKMNLRFKHYLYLSFKRHFYSIKKGIIPQKAKMKELSHENILELFTATNAIIDFPSTFQTGLTIRTFETLGAGKKLITTNKNIVNEPFYDSEYISIIDMNNIVLDVDFIRRAPKSSINEKIKNYSISSYVNQLFK